MTDSVQGSTQPPRVSKRRRIAFRIVAGLFGALSTGMLGIMGVLGAFLADDPDYRNHEIHDIAWGVFGLVYGIGLLVQVHRPERKLAPFRQSIAVVAVMATAAVLLREVEALPSLVILGGVLLVAGFLHPARSRLLRVDGGFGSALGAFAAAGAVAWLVYAVAQINRQLSTTPANSHTEYDHWAFMAIMSVVIAAVALLSSMKAPGWHICAYTAGGTSMLVGGVSVVLAAYPSSLGRVWGTLAVAGGLVFIAEAEWERRRERAAVASILKDEPEVAPPEPVPELGGEPERGRETSAPVRVFAAVVVITAGAAIAFAIGGSAISVVFVAIVGLVAFGRSHPLGAFGERVAQVAFVSFFAVYAAGATAFIVAGFLPALADWFPDLHRVLHEWGRGEGAFAGIANNVGRAAHGTEPGGNIGLGYLFSILNLVLGLFLMKLRPRDRTARLLALAMIGTAAVFNLQAHHARSVLPILAGSFHDMFHIVSGVAYVLALLLFPTGQFEPPWSQLRWWQWPIRAVYLIGLVVVALSIVSQFHGDAPTGWVVFFGFLIPVAGVISQLARYRHASSGTEQQQAKVLLTALSLSVVGALVMVGFGLTSGSGGPASQTRAYEFKTPAPGRYLFVCDPHADEMRGVLVVEDDTQASPRVELSAANGRFEADEFTLPADTEVVLSFTNRDDEGHNVSIYTENEKAVFVGSIFSGQDLSRLAFLVFPALFAAIPVTLFVVLVRFGLWDIGRVINRALVYGVLTAVLGGVYLGGVFVLGSAARTVTGQADNRIAIVISTLAVAALFQPARHRIQEFIDQRFYRQRYDAHRTLAVFTDRLHAEVDLTSMHDDLLGVVRDTMQPTHVSLWLRDAR